MPFISVQNKKIHYQTWGRGEPFLFVHGWGGSIDSLTPLAKLFANTHKSFLIDLPGFGQSNNPDPDWGVKEYSDTIVQLVTKLQLKRLIYFGHSFGGTIGINIAANHAGIFQKLILCAPSYKREQNPSGLAKLFNWLPSFLKKPIYQVFFPASDLYKFPHLENNFRKIVKEDLTSILGKIKIPTLILWGHSDVQISSSNAQELSKKIKDSKLKLFPDFGHSLPLVEPKLVFDEIKKFLYPFAFKSKRYNT